MIRERNYGNFALNRKLLKSIEKIFCIKNETEKISIYITRIIKEDGIEVSKTGTFSSFDKLIDYIDENNISKINQINIELWDKTNNVMNFDYNGYEHNWILKYHEKNIYTDSVVYNLNNLLKYKRVIKWSQYLNFALGICLLLTVMISYYINIKIFFMISIYAILTIIYILSNNRSAFKENKFWNKNRDGIILSTIFYVLGLLTDYIIKTIFK